MTRKRYPKSEVDRKSILQGPAYVSMDQEDAMNVYAKALEEVEVAVGHGFNTNDFRGLTTYSDGRPGLTYSDFDWFRPNQARPTKPKDVISFCRYVYRSVGLIHNAIDLMGDFCCQGIRLIHSSRAIERFYNEWFHEVRGKDVSERIGHLLFREANVPIRHYTAKINNRKRKEMQKAVAEDILVRKDPVYRKGEIPWKYVFLDPLLVEPFAGNISNISNKKLLILKIPQSLRNEIIRIQQGSNEIKAVLKDIAPDILQAANSQKDFIVLPPEKTNMLYYKKDDWQVWADPMTYAAFEDINLYQRLKLADKAALDGATSKIRVWKLGSLDHKLAPTPTASSTLSNMLGANVGGGTKDIIWGPDIELIETSSDVQAFLGEEKYRPTLMAIYAALGIPPTLTGTFGSSGTTNNFISLKTLVERLNYVRGIIIRFWNEQIKTVQKAMGFRSPAQVEFDVMYLEDPAAMTSLLLNMADRNIVSDEFVQRHVKAKPDIESRRLEKEDKIREKSKKEKVSPYHQVDQDHALKKIALQGGSVTPSEVGLELLEKKDGEEALVDRKFSGRNSEPSAPGQPGRPKNTRDVEDRKRREFQPRNKAAIKLWAKKAQAKISDILTPVVLKSFGKKHVRSLNQKQFNELECIKFEVLCNLPIDTQVDNESIAVAASKRNKDIHVDFDKWFEDAQKDLDGKLSVEDIRDLRASYYVYYNCER